jgi:hypothetical protein
MVMLFNTTFNNISVILWRSVLLVEETGVPRENHWLATSHWQTLSHNMVSSTLRLSRIRTHNFSGDSHWLHRNIWKIRKSCLNLNHHLYMGKTKCEAVTVKLLSNCPTLVISTFWIISKEKISHNMLMAVSRLKGKNVSEYKLEFIWC